MIHPCVSIQTSCDGNRISKAGLTEDNPGGLVRLSGDS